MAMIKRDTGNLMRERDQGQHLDPFRSLDPFRVMDALLQWDPFRQSGGWSARGAVSFVPHFDVKEGKDGYSIKADLPGVKEGDVEVAVTGNLLTISGRREEEHREENDQYFTMERSYGNFSRSFSLPDGADLANVTADLKDGVLNIHLPKKPEVQPKRIEIGKGSGLIGGGRNSPSA